VGGERGCRRGRDHMVIGFMYSVPITTKVVISNPIHNDTTFYDKVC
jgi:hypothetical protein